MASVFDADALRVAISTFAAITLVAAIELTGLPMLVAVLLLLVVAALGYGEPRSVPCAVLFTLPWFYHPIAIGTQHFPTAELLLLVGAPGVVFRVALAWMRQDGPRVMTTAILSSVIRSRLVLLATVLVAVGLVLALRPYDPSHRAESLREWRWTLFEPMVLLILLTVLRTRSAQFPLMRGFLAAALIGGATVAGVQAFFDFATGGGVQVAGVTRIAGPYPHPNALALYATRVVALAIAWMVFVPQVRRWLVLPTLIVTLTTLATFSRGALAAMVSGLSLLIPAIERRLRAAVIGSAGVVLSGLVLVERDRMLDLFGGGSGSLRLDIWRSTLRMIGDRPLTGYGPDQFLYAYLPRYIAPTAWSERFTSHAHNLILDFWVRLGIIGGAFAIAVVVIGTLRAYHVMRGRTRFDSLTAAGSVALVAAIVHGTVDNAYFAHDLAISGWFVAWLAFTPVSDDREERTPRARPRSWRSRFYRIPSL